jgi:hypothetical protein
MDGDDLHMTFTAERPGEFAWPVIEGDPGARAFIMPFNEGSYVPTDHAGWIGRLTGRDPIDTTEGLSMPFFGIDHGDFTLTYIATNQFGNEIQFTERDGRLGLRFAHRFGRLWEKKEFGFVIRRGGPSPIEPARQYRRWLVEQGGFVSMREKIAQLPAAEKLLGAAHIYLWGDAPLSHHNVLDWQGLASKLSGADRTGPAEHIWGRLDDETRGYIADAATQRRPQFWLRRHVADALSKLLLERDFFDAAAWKGIRLPAEAVALADEDALNEAEYRQLNMMALAAAFPGVFAPHETWGDGFSVKMMDAFAEAGLDRLWLGANSWQAGCNHPQAVARAEELGYLVGPYDSYDSVHDPDAGADDTWETAQFDRALYETGGMVKWNGEKRTGFQRKGYHLSPIAARPYVEKRVNGIFEVLPAPFNSWFIDCDAYGNLFDDYSELHPGTAEDDMNARLDRMAWIRDTFRLVIGSERGAGFAAPVMHFAHGMTTGAFGSWGDDEMNKDKESPYYLGAWWPPDAPGVFVKQVPLKPVYYTFHYDPAYRLPLYQTVFHDSVVTTHHWQRHSLKFTDQIDTVALTELLYTVPPLYHMNLDELEKHRDTILAHYGVFSPLHREIATLPMKDFAWLTEDRMVQRTSFGDSVTVTANFREKEWHGEGLDVPARSVLIRRRGADEIVYTPGRRAD